LLQGSEIVTQWDGSDNGACMLRHERERAAMALYMWPCGNVGAKRGQI